MPRFVAPVESVADVYDHDEELEDNTAEHDAMNAKQKNGSQVCAKYDRRRPCQGT